MALPGLIKVQSGGDPRLWAGLWLIWLAAAVTTLVNAARQPALLSMASVVLLLWALPRVSASLQPRQLQLQSNGSVSYADGHGRWSTNTWRSPWYTVIRIRTDQTQWWAWISARHNSAEDYRRLGIWCRYAPQQTGKQGNIGQLP